MYWILNPYHIIPEINDLEKTFKTLWEKEKKNDGDQYFLLFPHFLW